MEQPIAMRPLGKLMNLIDGLGYQMEYQYDDLVFVNHTAFLFRFDEQDSNLVLLHFNVDCEDETQRSIASKVKEVASKEGVSIDVSSNYEIVSEEGKEEVQIRFKS